MVERALVERAKADPEAFQRETVVALFDACFSWRANGVAGNIRRLSIEDSLRSAWPMDLPCPLDARAKAHSDALLQALTEMAPAEREKLVW